MRPLSYLKNKIVPAGGRPHTVLHAPFRQITLELSLQTEMQMYLGLFEKEIHFWIKGLTCNIANRDRRRSCLRRVYGALSDEDQCGRALCIRAGHRSSR